MDRWISLHGPPRIQDSKLADWAESITAQDRRESTKPHFPRPTRASIKASDTLSGLGNGKGKRRRDAEPTTATRNLRTAVNPRPTPTPTPPRRRVAFPDQKSLERLPPSPPHSPLLLLLLLSASQNPSYPRSDAVSPWPPPASPWKTPWLPLPPPSRRRRRQAAPRVAPVAARSLSPRSRRQPAAGCRRQVFSVELRPGETTIVSWKKLLKEAGHAAPRRRPPRRRWRWRRPTRRSLRSPVSLVR